jgi:transcriptional regulator with XRE-family HTH domain
VDAPVRSRLRNRGPVTPAEYIRRNVLQMSQAEVAQACRVAKGTVCQWESSKGGRVPRKHWAAYQRLAQSKARTLPPEWFDQLPLKVDV